MVQFGVCRVYCGTLLEGGGDAPYEDLKTCPGLYTLISEEGINSLL